MSNKIIDSLDKNYLISPVQTNMRSGTIIIHFGKDHERIIKILKDNDIYFDSRSKGIRLSPHIYNSEIQINSLISLIAKNQ